MKRQCLRNSIVVIFAVSGLGLFVACGDSSAPMPTGPSTTPFLPSASISVTPFNHKCSGASCVQIGGTEQFSARVSCAVGVTCPLASSQDFTWSVAGTGCAGASCGTIDVTGKYTAPASVPDPPTVTVTATSVADPRLHGIQEFAIVADLGASFSFSTKPTSVGFGNQMVNTTSAPTALTITNTGSTPQRVSGRIDGTPGQWQDFAFTNDCPTTLAAGASCTFSITFTPSATGGRGAFLIIDGLFDEEGVVNVGGTGVL